MKGDPGPYINDADVWVPRTVPWREARSEAMTAHPGDSWTRLRYIGKTDAEMLGFVRDCRCDEVCEAAPRDEYGDPTGERGPCWAPAWHFRLVEL